MTLLSLLFFMIAILYSMVGFGGGSSYIALLALGGVRYELIPQIALICNIIVVTGGVYFFNKYKYIKWNILWPLIIGSMPFAYFGGRLPVSKELFLSLLSAVLILAGLRVLFFNQKTNIQPVKEVHWFKLSLVGAVLGLLSGIVGIGGGIFLAPITLICNWARPKQIAAICSVFILLNSIAGLSGQFIKNYRGEQVLVFDALMNYGPLFFAVFLGGQVGSRLGSSKLSSFSVRNFTGILVVFVGVRIFFKLVL